MITQSRNINHTHMFTSHMHQYLREKNLLNLTERENVSKPSRMIEYQRLRSISTRMEVLEKITKENVQITQKAVTCSVLKTMPVSGKREFSSIVNWQEMGRKTPS